MAPRPMVIQRTTSDLDLGIIYRFYSFRNRSDGIGWVVGFSMAYGRLGWNG